MTQKPLIGGQAVIEGVMLRKSNKIAIAVRKADGQITTKRFKIKSLSDKLKFLKFPIFRGIVAFFEALIIGIKTLNWSAEQQLETGEKEKFGWALAATIIVSFIFAILLFVLLPYVLTYLLGLKEILNPILFNLVDGVIKLIILVLYILSISLISDVKRIFQYHGAEHKVVNCYEANDSFDNVKKYSTIHLRCGTSFLLAVIFVGVIILSFVPVITFNLYPTLKEAFWLQRYGILFLLRLAMLPLIAGISYELLKFSAKHQNWLTRIIASPGLLVQRLTTKEPDEKQIEVAFMAFNGLEKD